MRLAVEAETPEEMQEMLQEAITFLGKRGPASTAGPILTDPQKLRHCLERLEKERDAAIGDTQEALRRAADLEQVLRRLAERFNDCCTMTHDERSVYAEARAVLAGLPPTPAQDDARIEELQRERDDWK